jgi:Flp pilus assembly protein TadD
MRTWSVKFGLAAGLTALWLCVFWSISARPATAQVNGTTSALHAAEMAQGPKSSTGSEPSVAGANATDAAKRQEAWRCFTRAMKSMEELERGKGNEKTLLAALASAEEATLLDPQGAPYWHLLGYIYAKMRRDQFAEVMAEDALNKALSLSPENLPARLLLASLLLDRQSYALALDQLEWVGRKAPKLLNAALTADMCRAYIIDEQAARGERFFREMLGPRPEASALRLGLALMLHEQGKSQEARRLVADLARDSRADKAEVEYARRLEKAWMGGQQ